MGLARLRCLGRLFYLFGLFPLGQLVLQRYRLTGQHGGHSINELAHQGIGDVVDGEWLRGLFGDTRVKKHLQQDISDNLGQAREAVFAVTIPEERGSFRRFCELVGTRSVTEFNYRIADEKAHDQDGRAKGETDNRQSGTDRLAFQMSQDHTRAGRQEGRQANALDNRADAKFDQGNQDGTTGDNFVRITVFLAAVLFLVGIGSSFKLYGVRYALIGFGAALLIVSIVLIAQQPGLPAG